MYFLYDLTGVTGFKYNNNVYYYLKNLQGDIVGILDSNNQQIVEYQYDSWGNLLSIKDQFGNEISDSNHIGVLNPYRYRSYYYDTETKLYYINSRYYNPSWGRFVSVDSILGANDDIISYNLYTYVSNNPINNFDIDGHWKMPNWLKVTVGVAVIGGLAVAAVCLPGVGGAIAGAALTGALAGGTVGALGGAVAGGISGGKKGAAGGATTGFLGGTLVGAVGGATLGYASVATGTVVSGGTHASSIHRLATNVEAGKMLISNKYSSLYMNKALNSSGMVGTSRPDIIGIAKNGANKIVEVVSPKQSTTYIFNKVSKMTSSNPNSIGKVIVWVRKIFEIIG